MKEIKDWTKAIEDLGIMDADAVLATYSEMLATAHDLGYKIPDAQLIETEDPVKLREVIPPLHEGLLKHYATVKAEAKASDKPKPVKKTSASKDPAKTAAKKTAPQEKTMATTAKKAAAPAPAAKKAAKGAAKKTAKKGAAKKAAKANARTGVARNPFGENAVIKVLNKETGVRADSERGKRIAAVFKYNGKKVSAFFENEKPPYNRTDTLRFLIDRKFISVK